MGPARARTVSRNKSARAQPGRVPAAAAITGLMSRRSLRAARLARYVVSPPTHRWSPCRCSLRRRAARRRALAKYSRHSSGPTSSAIGLRSRRSTSASRRRRRSRRRAPTRPSNRRWQRLREVGIAVVVAAGNGGSTTDLAYPACVRGIVGVSSVGSAGTPSSFANRAPALSLFAPGETITAAAPGNATQIKSGTSQATPQVAGALALFRQREPSASFDALVALFDRTADVVVGPDGRRSPAGMLRIDRALDPRYQQPIGRILAVIPAARRPRGIARAAGARRARRVGGRSGQRVAGHVDCARRRKSQGVRADVRRRRRLAAIQPRRADRRRYPARVVHRHPRCSGDHLDESRVHQRDRSRWASRSVRSMSCGPGSVRSWCRVGRSTPMSRHPSTYTSTSTVC